MFNKETFSQILIRIYKTYNNQRDFADAAEVNRAYLSQYMNGKLENPPTPKILVKIANASHGLTTYEELMTICGHIKENDLDSYLSGMLGLTDQDMINFDTALKDIHLTDAEEKIYQNIIEEMRNETVHNNKEYKLDITKHIINEDSESQAKIIKALNLYMEFLQKMADFASIAISTEKKENKNSDNILFNIPILGKITAGQPILAEEYLEGYLPVDPNIYGMITPDNYFYLKVSGESMNLKIHNGDYALVHKQDYAENGDIVVAIVNGDDEATLKRYKKISDEMIMLEPMSTYPMEPIIINLKDTNFKIIGKAIGQFGKF